MSKNCALAVDIFTYDDHELDRILESTNLDEYKFIDLPEEQHDDLSQGTQVLEWLPLWILADVRARNL